MKTVSPRNPRAGAIPAHRLSDARRARDLWRPAIEADGGTLTIAIREDGFVLRARYPADVAIPRLCTLDGVPVRVVQDAHPLPTR